MEEIFITTVGKVVEGTENCETFVYNNTEYKKLMEWSDFPKILSKFSFDVAGLVFYCIIFTFFRCQS